MVTIGSDVPATLNRRRKKKKRKERNPAASDPLLPDLQMDRAARPSRSYKISLAWRYNSFSLYVSCQINLASSGAILVLVTQSIEETTSPVCVSLPVPGELMEIYLHVQRLQCHHLHFR